MSRRGGTEHGLHVRDVSQVLQQLVQRVLFVGRNGLQVLQKQLRKSKNYQSNIISVKKRVKKIVQKKQNWEIRQ